ncbi:MAG: NAD-glutamate dehydrogenase [Actinomycetota bacterium]|nr:NAD-glutamate dehydrogenase [Actinomycetota bacterium]
MAIARSAGALLFQSTPSGRVEVLLGHIGGPFYAHRDDDAWSIPKGEYGADKDPRTAAAREFEEELGAPLPAGREIELGTVRLPSGKRLTVYAVEADFDTSRQARSNTYELEWPPMPATMTARARRARMPHPRAEVNRRRGLAGLALRCDLAELIALYYRLVPAEELSTTEPAERAAAVRSHLALAVDRMPSGAVVRLLNPTLAEDGWHSRDTVVQIVTDDMPYLVDSVVAELARMNVSVRRLVHPIVVVRRDLTGTLREVLTGSNPDEVPADALVESWMYVNVDRITDLGRAHLVERRLLTVLTDVREVVEDTQRMINTAYALADRLEAAPPPLPAEEVADSAALLRWLADGHFIFLGYRCYELVRESINGSTDGTTLALRAMLGSGRGVLRRDSVAARGFRTGSDVDPLSRDLLVLTQASAPATVYRPVYPYYVGVKTFDESGEVTGEHRFLGVLATTALHEDVLHIPVIGRRVREVIRRAGVPVDSYSGQRMLEVLQTYPRAELFSTDPDSLYQTVTGVLSLAQRHTVRLFCQRDPYGRFFFCLVYLPRDRYTTAARLAMQEVLVRDLRGTGLEYSAQIGESVHARVHFTVHTDPDDSNVPSAPDVGAITERLEHAVLTWDDRLLDAAHAAAPIIGAATADLAQRYLAAFPQAYKEHFDAATALTDICRLEALAARDGLDLCFEVPEGAEPGQQRLKLYLAGQRITLSQVLPVLQQMDVEVIDERPYEVIRGDGVHCWIYDFGLRLDVTLLEQLAGQDPEDLQRRFCAAFVAAWRGACEVDRFNALVLHAGLNWRQAAVLRGYVRYLQQARSRYSQQYVEEVLLAHSDIAAALVALFEARFDPALDAITRDISHDELATHVSTMIDEVAGLDADRILRSLLMLVRATLRTNYYLHNGTDAVAGSRPYLAFKLDPKAVPDLPEPRPAFEIFVCSPRVEGVHVRFGPVARGGLRWSDRREDFRTEVLGLAEAQAVKNAVIVPAGAKGAFVAKRPPPPTGDPGLDREAVQAEGIVCYRMFVSGLLDLTDNLVDGISRHPDRVVCYDGDDSYLVVAADKGTATFSDIANEIAASYGFWLGDAFASGGSAGYDHKAMGITARGVWESVKRHFLELGIDTQTEDFTVVGIGDMSGDVFGNGMLRSEHIRLLAAFDHRHVFVDPNPDPASSYAERRRLFELPRSSWDDYDRSLISTGGGVWPRSAKRIPVSVQMRRALGIAEGITELSPPELIRAILLSPAQLLFNGGVGTFIKASTETHADVADKANDAIRIDGAQLRVRVVAEGGNLGLTQRGRIEFARAGGKLNTDAVDNSAGVDCSDHEVNIKILLDRLVADGVLKSAQRRALLIEMTDEVAALTLARNADQNTQLGVSRAHAASMVSVHGRLVTYLEQRHGLNRKLAILPTRAQWEARQSAGEGLTSPELSTLMAHVKLGLTDEVLASDLPDAEVFRARLPEYFPAPLRDRFTAAIREHPLRREIITTFLVNEVVDRGGMTYAFRLAEELSVSAPDAVRAYSVAVAVFDLRATWQAIADLGTAVPISVADTMTLALSRLLDRASRWLLLNRPQPLAVGAEINRFRPSVQALASRIPDWQAHEADSVAAAARRFTEQGVPDELARRVSAGLTHFGLLDVVEVAKLAKQDAEQVAQLYYALSTHLGIDQMLSLVSELDRGDRWHALARLALQDDLYASLRKITLDALRTGGIGGDSMTTIARWEQENSSRLSRTRATLNEVSHAGILDLATLSVAVRALTCL